MRNCLLLLAVTLLQGCLTSKTPFIDASNSAHPLQEGFYEKCKFDVKTGETSLCKIILIRQTSDGGYISRETEGYIRESFRLMNMEDSKYLFQAHFSGGDWVYGMAQTQGDGFIAIIPKCKDLTLPLIRELYQNGFITDIDEKGNSCLVRNPAVVAHIFATGPTRLKQRWLQSADVYKVTKLDESAARKKVSDELHQKIDKFIEMIYKNRAAGDLSNDLNIPTSRFLALFANIVASDDSRLLNARKKLGLAHLENEYTKAAAGKISEAFAYCSKIPENLVREDCYRWLSEAVIPFNEAPTNISYIDLPYRQDLCSAYKAFEIRQHFNSDGAPLKKANLNAPLISRFWSDELMCGSL